MSWMPRHAIIALPLLAPMIAAADDPLPANSNLVQELQAQLKTDQATITRLEGQLKVTLLDRILFPEGSWYLSQHGKQTLAALVPTLKTLSDTRIVVNGYTDNVPIAASYRDDMPSNWELASARAGNVVRYFQSQGVSPDLMSAASYGETHPVAGNDTVTGRDKNRRIEVTLVGPNI